MVDKIKDAAKQSSWKTTMFGIGVILTVIGGGLTSLFDNDPKTVLSITSMVASFQAGLAAIFARDNKKSDESVGAK